LPSCVFGKDADGKTKAKIVSNKTDFAFKQSLGFRATPNWLSAFYIVTMAAAVALQAVIR
jgi:hypothetical protein